MNDSQQVATLAGIPMDQVKEFIRQYIEMAMVSNTITLCIAGVVLILCVYGVYRCINSRYRSTSSGAACFWAGCIALIVLLGSSWERYKMTHYPIPWVIQDLRDSK